MSSQHSGAAQLQRQSSDDLPSIGDEDDQEDGESPEEGGGCLLGACTVRVTRPCLLSCGEAQCCSCTQMT